MTAIESDACVGNPLVAVEQGFTASFAALLQRFRVLVSFPKFDLTASVMLHGDVSKLFADYAQATRAAYFSGNVFTLRSQDVLAGLEDQVAAVVAEVLSGYNLKETASILKAATHVAAAQQTLRVAFQQLAQELPEINLREIVSVYLADRCQPVGQVVGALTRNVTAQAEAVFRSGEGDLAALRDVFRLAQSLTVAAKRNEWMQREAQQMVSKFGAWATAAIPADVATIVDVTAAKVGAVELIAAALFGPGSACARDGRLAVQQAMLSKSVDKVLAHPAIGPAATVGRNDVHSLCQLVHAFDFDASASARIRTEAGAAFGAALTAILKTDEQVTEGALHVRQFLRRVGQEGLAGSHAFDLSATLNAAVDAVALSVPMDRWVCAALDRAIKRKFGTAADVEAAKAVAALARTSPHPREFGDRWCALLAGRLARRGCSRSAELLALEELQRHLPPLTLHRAAVMLSESAGGVVSALVWPEMIHGPSTQNTLVAAPEVIAAPVRASAAKVGGGAAPDWHLTAVTARIKVGGTALEVSGSAAQVIVLQASLVGPQKATPAGIAATTHFTEQTVHLLLASLKAAGLVRWAGGDAPAEPVAELPTMEKLVLPSVSTTATGALPS